MIDQQKLDDLEKVSGFPASFILQIAQDTAWLRETTCRRTAAVSGITREETDAAAIHYADVVAAVLVAMRDKANPQGFTIAFTEPVPKKTESAADFI